MFILFVTGLQKQLFAQEYSKVVAKIGGTVITDEEFVERYELTPHFGKHRTRQAAGNRLRFLYTLIAEKLWALQAVQERLDTSEAIITSTEAFEKMFIRDYMFKTEIREKVSVSREEVINGLIKNAATLYVNFLFSEDEEEIFNLYDLLKQGIPFDTILAESPELDEQISPMEIVYGQMQEEIEDSLYSLKLGEFTAPIYTPDGWYIFRLTNRLQKVIVATSEESEEYQTVSKIISARKEKEVYADFYYNFFKDKKVDADAILLKSLAVRISGILSDKKSKSSLSDTDKVYLEPLQVVNLLNSYPSDTLKMVIIKFQDDPITLRRFILLLAFDGFSVINTALENVFSSLNSRTRTFIEREFIAREGIKRGILTIPEVRNQITMWRNNYLFQILQNKFIDSAEVSVQEALDFYNRKNREFTYPKQVNIIEILTDSLEIVQTILDEIDTGSDFKLLAKKYSKREFTKGHDGEYGFFPITLHGEIGRIASMLEIGEVYGPISLPEGYSIIKLIGRKEEYIEKPSKSFNELKDKIIRDLRAAKVKKMLIDYTVKLAFKFGIDIDPDVFNSLQTTDLNSFGIRFLGFGGRITAAPLLAPQEDWIEEYFRQQNKLP